MFSKRLTTFLIRYRYGLFLLALVAAVASWIPASRLTLDRTIDTMFAADDPLLPPYRRLKRTFGGNDIVLAVYDDPGLFDADQRGMERLEQIGNRLAEIPGVRGIFSINMLIGNKIADADDVVAGQLRKLFEGYTHGADGRTTCVACMLEPEENTEFSRPEIIERIRDQMRQLPGGLEPGLVTGEPVMLNDAFRFVEQDGLRLSTTTTLLLSLVILACFRSLRWVLIPVLVVQLALLLTNGLLAISGTQLTMISSMLTAVVTVVGVALVVHVIVRFREGRESGLRPLAALTRASRILVGPVFWACVTDAVGFGALMAAQVAPVRDFGLMMALGAMMVLVSAALLVPALALIGQHGRDPRPFLGEHALDTQLGRLVGSVKRHPTMWGVVFFVVSVIAVSGIARLQTETDFTKNFRSSTDIVKSYQLVESRLGGAGVCDVLLPAPSRLSWSFLRKVLHLEQRLRDEVQVSVEPGESTPGLTKVISLGDAVLDAAPFDLARMRRGRQVFINAGLGVMHRRIPAFYEAMYHVDPLSPDQHYYRIMLRALERQPAEQKRDILQQIEDISTAEFESAEITGYFALLTNLIDSVLRDQWRTFLVALIGILVTMTIALRSLKLALVALVPNAVPILVVNGVMGWLGLRVNMGAAMIAAVSVGLSIDSSIHYLFAFRRARQAGKTRDEALDEVQRTVGRALVLATVALVIGFAVLATSDFIPTVYFGVLVSLAMLGGLAGNLLWLPLLLRLVNTDYLQPRAPKTTVMMDVA